MIHFAVLVLAPYVAADAGLTWNFDGEIRKGSGRYELVGKEIRGDLTWFVAKKGAFSAEKLYESDVRRTKDAPESKDFTEKRSAFVLAGVPAIQSDQRYTWNRAAVVCRCVYAASDGRAWVVRLWWPPESDGSKAAERFLKSVRLVRSGR